MARVVGVGSAVPEHVHKTTEAIERVYSRLPGWDPAWAELVLASRVERKATVIEDPERYYRQVPSTAERMQAFEPAARRLGLQAAERALARAGAGAAQAIGDLIAVSCTGYAGPGLDLHLVEDLGLAPEVRRLFVGHMGCYAALPGLRVAAALSAASGRGVLVDCVELCTLHLQPPTRREEIVQIALFADGAGAAVVAPEGDGPRIVGARTVAVPRSQDRMTWAVADDGFRMWLSPRVPAIIERGIGPFVDALLDQHGLAVADVDHWVIHPGGPEILERIHRRLGLGAGALDRSWEALADGGNRSSATVLAILDGLLAESGVGPGEWVVMLAFGTGLTMEALLLRG
ncbi:MAG TPA: type III polyketide synthase [Actinomycetes bacterium]|nr:type III polyketide synthase [Actinomycetes bacterium]